MATSSLARATSFASPAGALVADDELGRATVYGG